METRVSGEPASLLDLALQQCVRFSANFTDFGDVRYQLVRPILFRLTARQLQFIEERNPHLVPDTDEVWRMLISKEFPDRHAPPGAVREAYQTLLQEKNVMLGAACERLRKKQKQFEKAKVASAIVPISEPISRRAGSGPNSTSSPGYTYRSRQMQQLARQAHAQALARGSRQPKRPDPVSHYGGATKYAKVTNMSSPFSSSRPGSPSQSPRVAMNGDSRSMVEVSPTNTAPITTGPPSIRRRRPATSSIFIARR